MDDRSDGDGRVAWRHLERHLWVGSGPDGCLGTIEEGRRFLAIDRSGTVLARCRSLDAAKAALAGLIALRGPADTSRAR